MNTTMISDVLVFKTSIHSESDVDRIAAVLDNALHIKKWNVDREDVDRILRIESDDQHTEYFIRLITGAGFECEALPD